MPSPLRLIGALLAVLTLAACDDTPSPSEDLPTDAAAPADLATDAATGTHDAALDADADADAGLDAMPDVALDLSAPDVALDMAAPDTATLDMAAPDMAAPDMAAPDMAAPDLGPALDPPLITEISATATTLDDDGDPSDWIELYNPNDLPYPLDRHHLTDDPDDLTRWRLPAVELAPRGYLVVYASDKDRADPFAPLHTDFRLAADRESVTLTDPDGRPLDTLGPWPTQIDAATYGRPMHIERTPLLAPDALVRHAPLPSIDDDWTRPRYDDAAWTEDPMPLGSGAIDPLDGPVLADSIADWDPTGTQGTRGWTYGYSDRTDDPEYDIDDFTPFPRDGGGHSPTDAWNGTSYAFFDGDPPWTLVGREDMHPNGINNGVEHWAVRRWQAPADARVIVEWHLRKTDPNGAGVTGRFYHHGALVDRLPIGGGNLVGQTTWIELDVQAGDLLDFALDPAAANGDVNDGADGSAMTVRVVQRLDLDLTPLPDHRPGDGLATRVWFTVPDDAPRDGLELTSTHDDGYIVAIDGRALAGHNAPPFLAPEARALTDRATAAALTPYRRPLPAHAPGDHLLALAALDAPVDDGAFFIGYGLDALDVTVLDGAAYLTPTPGAPNSPIADVGPIVYDLTRDPEVMPDEPITVSVHVIATAAPIERVTLTWRRRFAPTEAIEMAPDPDDGTRWHATLPGHPPAELVRWHAIATALDGRQTREPPYPDPLDSEEYYGTVIADPALDTDLPVLHWYIEQPALADRDAGTRSTLWHQGTLYDNVRADIHGQSTRGFPKKSYDIDFNADHRFELDPDLPRMKDINLLTTYADKSRLRNTLAYEVFAAAGHAYHLAFPLRVQRNGDFFAIADFVEDADDRWLERLGYREGALYKMYDRLENADTAEKKTRRDEDNDDLRALVGALDLPLEQRTAWIHDNVDLARMANFLAASFVIGNVDCCHKNYYMYRDTPGTAQWWMMPWDVDLSFGRVWTGTYFDDTLYPDTGLYLGRDAGSRNALLTALYTIPAFEAMYLRRTRSLVDRLLQPPEAPAPWLEALITSIARQIGDDAALDEAMWPTWGQPQTMQQGIDNLRAYLDARRRHVYDTLVAAPDAPVDAPPLIDPEPGVIAAYRVPTDDDPALAWTTLDHDDALWLRGPLAIGYENSPADYTPYLRSFIRPADTDPGATTVQIRVPFTVDDPANYPDLTLSMRYDDGYVAWINGVEVARRNVAGLPAWNARAADHGDNLAVRYEHAPIDPTVLVAGDNVLAVQIVNVNPNSSDLLAQPYLGDGPPAGPAGARALPAAQDPLAPTRIELASHRAADPDEAYLTLHNPTDDAIDLSDHTLQGAGITHPLAPGTVIPPGATLHVTADLPAWLDRRESPRGGEAHLVQGDYDGALDPDAEPLRLVAPPLDL